MAVTLSDKGRVLSMLDRCNRHYGALVASGCDEGVALDRTWDCWDIAVGGRDGTCFDPRDRLLLNELRTIWRREVPPCAV